MKKITTYIIEKLKIDKESGKHNLSDLIYCVVMNEDLIDLFDDIKEELVTKLDEDTYYSCFVSKNKKDILLEKYNETWVSYFLISNRYHKLSIEEFIEKYNNQELQSPCEPISYNYLKNL